MKKIGFLIALFFLTLVGHGTSDRCALRGEMAYAIQSRTVSPEYWTHVCCQCRKTSRQPSVAGGRVSQHLSRCIPMAKDTFLPVGLYLLYRSVIE